MVDTIFLLLYIRDKRNRVALQHCSCQSCLSKFSNCALSCWHLHSLVAYCHSSAGWYFVIARAVVLLPGCKIAPSAVVQTRAFFF